MSSQYTKIQASQSAPYTSTRNLLDFHIEPNVYDMSKSYVEFTTEINVVDDDNTLNTGTGIYNLRVGNTKSDGSTNNPQAYTENCAIVKNVVFKTQAKGILENRRDNDRYRQNLNYYTKTSDELISNSWYSLQNISATDDFLTGGFVEFQGEGTKESKNITRLLRVPVKDLISLGSVKNLDLNRLGRSTLHLELQLQNLKVLQEQRSDDPKFVANARNRNEFLDIPQNTADPNILVSKGTYIDLDQNPFFVGMKLTLTAVHTDGGANNINTVVKITGISNATTAGLYGNDVGDRLEITFTPAIASTLAGKTYTDVVAVPVDLNTTGGGDRKVSNSSVSFTNANLVLNIPDSPMVSNNAMVYSTYLVESDNGNGSTSFVKNYDLEPECRNVMVCFNQNTISKDIQLSTYRVSIDNEDLTDRDVKFGSAEHNSLLEKYFSNSGRSLKRIKNEFFTSLSKEDGANHEAGLIEIIAFPVPLTETVKQLRLEINSNGLNHFHIFKDVDRAI